jgi:argininosuccinate lyase
MEKLWSGRFKKKTAKSVEGFTSSLSFDVRLWKYDIEGSVAHVKMLGKQKIIPRKDERVIVKGLNAIKSEIKNGKFKFHESLEDIHMNIEHALIRKIGPVGGKVHTARSRNDQVVLDLRLFLRDEISETLELIKGFQRTLVSLAKKYIDLNMPGYTHLQRAQPVLLSHHLLAYFEMLERDKERFEESFKRVNVMPLGSAALAGTTLPVNRQYVAKLLNFPKISKNSIDAVSDRDFVIEFISASGILIVELPDQFATGSSIMPQKKNPDVLELTRGRTGRVYGNLMNMLTVMKGLPLAYNRDLQEDKEPVFDTVDTIKMCLDILTKMMPKVRFRKDIMGNAAAAGFMTATDIAEYLVKKNVPFREAHNIAGKIVNYCINNNKLLSDLTLKEFKLFSNVIGRDILSAISVESSINRKKSQGSTSKAEVLKRINQLKNNKC